MAYTDPKGGALSNELIGQSTIQWRDPITGEMWRGNLISSNPTLDPWGNESLIQNNNNYYSWAKIGGSSFGSGGGGAGTTLRNVTNTAPGNIGMGNQDVKSIAAGYPSLRMDRYTRDTNVPLTGTQHDIIGLTGQMVHGDYGNYRSLLSGRPDYGLLQEGVIEPARQNLREYELPMLENTFSGGAYGDAYWGGMRQQAQAGALRRQANQEATLRYQAQQDATKNMLSAVQLLPGFMEISNTELKNNVDNLMRSIEVHYKNQGLTQQEWVADMQKVAQALEQAKFDWKKYIDVETLQQSQAQFNATWSQNERQLNIQQQNANSNSLTAARSGGSGGSGGYRAIASANSATNTNRAAQIMASTMQQSLSDRSSGGQRNMNLVANTFQNLYNSGDYVSAYNYGSANLPSLYNSGYNNYNDYSGTSTWTTDSYGRRRLSGATNSYGSRQIIPSNTNRMN